MEITKENEDQLRRLKMYFPYRVVFGVLYNDGNFETYAKNDKRLLNKFLKNPEVKVYSFTK